jgi:tetratricopeptide (TPR) repeat protein
VNTVYNAHTRSAYQAGYYTGTFAVADILSRGDTGLGALDGNDGEPVIGTGAAWRMRSGHATYTATSFTRLCKDKLGIRQSMGRVGSCFDNATSSPHSLVPDTDRALLRSVGAEPLSSVRGDDSRMKTKPIWLVPFAVVVVTLVAWLSYSPIGPAWVKTSLLVGVIVTGAFAQSYVDWVLKRAADRRKAIELPERRLPGGPAGLLRADQHVVPFIGRDEYAALQKWCQGGNTPVGLLVGAGGVGKTRLALQLGTHLQSHGWSSTVIGADREANALSTMRAVTGHPIFLVVDYAETRTGLVDLLREVANDPARVRLLLIARSVGDWWLQLGADVAAVRQLVHTCARWELSARLDSSCSSAELVRSAVPHFAAALQVPVPSTIDVSVPVDAPLLVVHAAALLTVLRAQRPATPADGRLSDIAAVLDELLGHEMHHWERSAVQAGLGDVSVVVLQRAVAVVCLLSAVDEGDGASILRRVPDLRDDEPLRRHVARWLRQLYPADAGYWGALQPELVAETHIIQQLVECPELIMTGLAQLREEQARHVIRMLSLGAAHHRAGRQLLETLLRTDIEGLVFAALTVTTTTGGELGAVLAHVLDDSEVVPQSLIARIEPKIPYPTTALAGAAVTVARRMLAALPSDADPAEVARREEELGTVLAQDCQSSDALPHLKRAVALYQQLFLIDRDRHRPGLARALHRLGIRHADLGNLDKAVTYARQAVALYRDQTDGVRDRHVADLAACLHNVGIWLTELGRDDEARPSLQEAVQHFQALADVDPDRYLHLRDQAQDLINQSMSSTRLEDLVQRSRQRVESDRDRYLPDLARDLHNLGNRLSGQGQPALAQPHLEDALTCYRELARTTRTYHPDMASCLHDLGVTLAALDRLAEALACTQQAVDLREDLADANPQRHQPELANSRDHLVVVLYRLGRYLDALSPAERAVELYRRLADTPAKRFRPELARALVNWSVSLSELARHAEALPAAQEAVEIYRGLVDDRSQRYKPRLAHALDNLAVDYSALSRHVEADHCRHVARQLRRAHG